MTDQEFKNEVIARMAPLAEASEVGEFLSPFGANYYAYDGRVKLGHGDPYDDTTIGKLPEGASLYDIAFEHHKGCVLKSLGL